MSASPAPADLGDEGSALWESIAGAYTLRPDEIATLEDACRITDMIAALTEQWVELGRPMMTKGSMGQDIIHPLVDKTTDQRMKRNTLLARLRLPDAEGSGKVNQQRDAAQTRWSQQHGTGA